MIDRVYAETLAGDWLNEDVFALVLGARARALPVVGFDGPDVTTRDLSDRALVRGAVGTVLSALAAFGVPAPDVGVGPPSHLLAPYYGRRVWSWTLAEARRCADGGRPVFIKPRGHHRAFRGHVTTGSDDLRTAALHDDFPVTCADVREFVAEYRGFVRHGELVGLRHSAGDGTRGLDWRVVRAAVNAWRGPAGYAIDFGLDPEGDTYVVGVKDALGLASYGLAPDLYFDLVAARWSELVVGATCR